MNICEAKDMLELPMCLATFQNAHRVRRGTSPCCGGMMPGDVGSGGSLGTKAREESAKARTADKGRCFIYFMELLSRTRQAS